jgi:methyl-accepting chemotaxis protein
MANWTIGRKLGVTSVSAGLMTLAIAGLSFWITRSLSDVIDDAYERDVKKQVLAGDLSADLRQMEAKEEAAVSSVLQKNADRYRAEAEEFATVSAEADKYLGQLRAILETDAERSGFAEVERLMAAWKPLHVELASRLDAGQIDTAVKLLDDSLDQLIGHLDAADTSLVEEFSRTDLASNADGDALVQRANMLLMIFSLLGGAAAVVTLTVVAQVSRTLRGVSTDLSQGARQVAAASEQVAGAAQSLAQGATEQAASLEETSASMEELASMTRKNAEHSNQAATLMSEVDRKVVDSNRALESMVAAMSSIRDSSQRVSKIIKTIDEIAFQTNILALNAAVEAARAGEAGMGFAVVADEVRNLAQRSAQAAKDTAGLIEESIVKSHDGHARVEQVAVAIASITDSVTQVKGLVDGVDLASREQKQGFDQIAQAIVQMETVTQTTAATSEESAAASEELNAQAEATIATVRQLESMVGTDSAGPGQARPSGSGSVSKIRSFAGRVAAPRRAPQVESEVPLGRTGTHGRF